MIHECSQSKAQESESTTANTDDVDEKIEVKGEDGKENGWVVGHIVSDGDCLSHSKSVSRCR